MTMIGYAHVAMELWGCVFCFIAAFSMSWIRSRKQWKQDSLFMFLLLFNSLLLASDSVAWLFRGNESRVGFWVVRISNFCVFSLTYLLMYTFTKYLNERVLQVGGTPVRWNLRVMRITGIVYLTVLVLTQFYPICYYFDAQNVYHRAGLYWLTQLVGLLGIVVNVRSVLDNRNRFNRNEVWAFSTYLALPIVAMVVQYLVYGISFLNIAITASVLLLYLQTLVEQAIAMYGQEKQIVQQQKELTNMRIQVMLSQIQPHFMYNCLNAIYYLCDKNPKEAQEAITRFSDYMRGNLDSLRQNELVPFEFELRHIRNYLALEKMRFEEDLEIEYHIGTTDFILPALSIQPLVENAVRHGVGKKIDGGTVSITTRAMPDGTEILVDDDGVGFDKNVKKEDGRSHTGMESVGDRLKAMCGGELQIDSVPGKGTHARVWIPKHFDPAQQNEAEETQHHNFADMTWDRLKSSLS